MQGHATSVLNNTKGDLKQRFKAQLTHPLPDIGSMLIPAEIIDCGQSASMQCHDFHQEYFFGKSFQSAQGHSTNSLLKCSFFLLNAIKGIKSSVPLSTEFKSLNKDIFMASQAAAAYKRQLWEKGCYIADHEQRYKNQEEDLFTRQIVLYLPYQRPNENGLYMESNADQQEKFLAHALEQGWCDPNTQYTMLIEAFGAHIVHKLVPDLPLPHTKENQALRNVTFD